MEPTENTDQSRVVKLECFLGRQPIYDGNREIRAYELLYRHNAADGAAKFVNGDQASAEVLLSAFLDIGLAKISPNQPVFINHTTALLGMDPIVPKDRCVIEVLEDVQVNPKTIASLNRLKDLGYRIALDDFTYSESQIPFILLADYVKLDLRSMTSEEFRRHVAVLKGFGVKIIAEKIESAEEFESSKALGCDLFQGYYLHRPETLSGGRIPANRLSALSLLAECINPEQSSVTIAAILSRDAALLYGVLRLANSALYGSRMRIQSPVHAVTMLGMDRVFRWASLLVLSGCNDCPIGYLGFALQRARTCEIVAGAYGSNPQLGYMAGLLSTLDSILNAPLEDIILPLPIDPRFKQAILDRKGELGAVLDAVVGYEGGSFDTSVQHGFSIHRVQAAYWEAVTYSASMMANLNAATPSLAR